MRVFCIVLIAVSVVGCDTPTTLQEAKGNPGLEDEIVAGTDGGYRTVEMEFRDTAPAFAELQEFPVPAEVLLDIDEVLYGYDPPGSWMGDGTTVLVARLKDESLTSFVEKHASVELDWSCHDYHIGDVGLRGPELIEWFHDWHEAAGIRDELAAVVDWESLLTQGSPRRYYRIWYKLESGGGLANARLWIIDIESRTLVFLLVNT